MNKEFLHLYIAAIILLISPGYAQSEIRNAEARGSLKHSEVQSSIVKKQQEVLIAEILRLKAELKESKLENDNNAPIQEEALLTELANERLKSDLLERKLEKAAKLSVSSSDQTKQKYQALKKALISLKQENSELNLKLQSAKSEQVNLDNEKLKNSRLNAELSKVLSRIDSIEQGYNKKLESYKSELSRSSVEQQDLLVKQDSINLKLTKALELNSELEKKYEALKKALEATSEKAKEYSSQNQTQRTEIENLKSKISSALNKISILKVAENDLAKLKLEHGAVKTEVAQCMDGARSLNVELQNLQELEKEYIILKNESMLRNSEPGLLKNRKSRRNRASNGNASRNVEDEQKYNQTRLAFEKAQKELAGYTRQEPSKFTSTTSKESNVLTITGSKVNLRNGPGLKHSPIMQISKGAKLTIESKEGEWYRVYTPTGSRAYVHQDVVSVDMVESKPSRDQKKLVSFGEVKIGGNIDTENLAIRKLRDAMGTR